MNEIFSEVGIKAFFRHLAENYQTFTLKQWNGQSGAILRQDVDLSLEMAECFMEWQKECGLRSTFFVLLTQPTYNPFSASNRNILRRMVREGFEVGLHFDPTVDDDERRLHRESQILAELCEQDIVSVSLHNPTSRGEFPLYEGYKNAYDPKVFTPETYLSDSRMIWRYDPWEFVKRSADRTIQLLFHPLHYVAGGSYEEILGRYLESQIQATDACFRPFNSTYRGQIQPDLLTWFKSDGLA
jgi:hypothetical protein